MEEILDDQNLDKPKGRKGEISAYLFLATLVFFVISYLAKLGLDKYEFHSSIHMEKVSPIILLFSILSCLIGLVFAIFSFIKKEKTKKKLIGLVGHGLVILIYISIFAYILGR